MRQAPRWLHSNLETPIIKEKHAKKEIQVFCSISCDFVIDFLEKNKKQKDFYCPLYLWCICQQDEQKLYLLLVVLRVL